MRKLVFQLLLVCSCASILGAQGRWYSLEKLSPSINTKVSQELRPIVSQDGSEMYFTRQGHKYFEKTLFENGQDLSKSLSEADYNQRLLAIYNQLGGEQVVHPSQSSFNQDIWKANNIESDLTVVHHLKSPINNAFPNSMCALGSNDEEAIVVNQFPESGGVQKGFSLIKKINGKWSAPVPIEIEGLGDIEPDVNLAISSDGTYILLSIQRYDSYGRSNDLYISERIGVTKFAAPEHLGPAINSPYHEAAPFISPDGKTLFFSSNRHSDRGDSDIYFANRLGESWQSWTSPRPLMSPVNSSSDESHPFFIERTGQLYFSSKRDGSSDIFRVQIAPPNSSMVTLSGNVTTGHGRKPVKAYLIAEPVKGGNFRKVAKTQNGRYKMTLPKGKAYEIEARGLGHLNTKKEVFLNPNYVYFKDYPLDFKLIPTANGEAIVLDKIQFKQSTAILLSSSWPALENLAEVMISNPSLHILIEGHTDNVGLNHQLLALSEERAEAIQSYLVLNHDINEGRILTAGHGDLRPLNSNSTESERIQNRRVEVSVIDKANWPNQTFTASSRRK